MPLSVDKSGGKYCRLHKVPAILVVALSPCLNFALCDIQGQAGTRSGAGHWRGLDGLNTGCSATRETASSPLVAARTGWFLRRNARLRKARIFRSSSTSNRGEKVAFDGDLLWAVRGQEARHFVGWKRFADQVILHHVALQQPQMARLAEYAGVLRACSRESIYADRVMRATVQNTSE